MNDHHPAWQGTEPGLQGHSVFHTGQDTGSLGKLRRFGSPSMGCALFVSC